MKEKGKAMHHQGSKAIKADLNKHLESLPSTFGKGRKPVLDQIKAEIKLFFEQNSSTGTRKLSTRRVVSPAKVVLQEHILAQIAKLVDAWKSECPKVPEPELEEAQNDSGLEDDRFFDLGERDNDYEDESDDDE